MNELLQQCEADIASRQASVELALKTPKRLRADKPERRRRRQSPAELGEGYDQLPEPYSTYHRIAMRFAIKALLNEQADLLHDIIEGLSRVAKRKADTGQDFTEPAMYRVAEHIKDHYWYKHYSYTNGLDCQHCSKAQKARCRYNWAHSDWAYADCHRAITLESINQPIVDSEGTITELANLIADDKALDLDEWLDAKTFLIGAPIRLKKIAMKLHKGESLSHPDRNYLSRLRRKQQLGLLSGTF